MLSIHKHIGDEMDFLEFAKERYSCRMIEGKPVPQEDIDKIIEAARIAPTAINGQPFEIFVMQSDESKEVIRNIISSTYGANTFLVVGARVEDGPVRKSDGLNFPTVDATIAATHMMLEIEQLGLATTWIGAFDPIGLKEAYPQMKDLLLIGIFPIGYKTEGSHPSKKHSTYKSVDELVYYL